MWMTARKKFVREIKEHCARERDFIGQHFSKLYTKVQLPHQREA